MTPDQFWYGDPDDYETYVTAYHDRVNRTAWFNGLYIFEAVSAAINNVMPGAIGTAFSKNHKVKPIKYHEKPIEMFGKPKIEKQESKQSNDDYALNKWVHKFRYLKGARDNA